MFLLGILVGSLITIGVYGFKKMWYNLFESEE
jgi:hypothetical protein